MEEVDTVMRDLFYIYQNSGKRLRKLCCLHEILKDEYSFENGEVKPSKSTGTCWIDHKLQAMKAFIDKRGLHLSHMQYVIADTSKKNDKATLEGKRKCIKRLTLSNELKRLKAHSSNTKLCNAEYKKLMLLPPLRCQLLNMFFQ